jgi:hypothetical protein
LLLLLCRQLEQQARLAWRKPDFNFYVNYLHRKIALYDQLAGRWAGFNSPSATNFSFEPLEA